MDKIHSAIYAIRKQNPWIGCTLQSLDIQVSERFDTMATNGVALMVNADFADTLDGFDYGALQAVLVHEALHVISRHMLRRFSRDFQIFNAACDHAINGLVFKLGYRLPKNALDAWHEDCSAEQIYDVLKTEQEQQQQGDSDDSESEDSDTGNDDSAPSDVPDTDKPDVSEQSSSDSDSEGNDSDTASDTGDSAGDTDKPDNSAELAANDASFDAPGSVLDYPLQPGQTMADAERDISEKIAKAMAIAKMCGDEPGVHEKEIFERMDSHVNWPQELLRYMEQHGGSSYSLSPPNRRLMNSGIIANRLNKSGCGNVVIVADNSSSMDREKLNTMLTNVELILDNIDYETVRLIGCNNHVNFDRTYSRGEPFDADELRIGGGTDFNPAFDLVNDDMHPDLLIYFTDMEVYASRAPDHEPDYPVVWAAVVDGYDVKITDGQFVTEYDSYFAPTWGHIIDLNQ